MFLIHVIYIFFFGSSLSSLLHVSHIILRKENRTTLGLGDNNRTVIEIHYRDHDIGTNNESQGFWELCTVATKAKPEK